MMNFTGDDAAALLRRPPTPATLAGAPFGFRRTKEGTFVVDSFLWGSLFHQVGAAGEAHVNDVALLALRALPTDEARATVLSRMALDMVPGHALDILYELFDDPRFPKQFPNNDLADLIDAILLNVSDADLEVVVANVRAQRKEREDEPDLHLDALAYVRVPCRYGTACRGTGSVLAAAPVAPNERPTCPDCAKASRKERGRP